MTIVICVFLILLPLLFIYQLYVRIKLEKFNSNNSDNIKIKKKINFYKNKEANRSLILLMVAICLFSFILLLIFYRQETLNKENKNLQLKFEEIQTMRDNDNFIIEDYQDELLKLNKFSWDQLLEIKDEEEIGGYEAQLANELEPFLGKNDLSVVISEKTNTLTLSIFPSVLTFENFQKAESNIEKFVSELQEVKEVTMIDFNFSYHNENNRLSKQSIVYSRETIDSDLQKLDL